MVAHHPLPLDAGTGRLTDTSSSKTLDHGPGWRRAATWEQQKWVVTWPMLGSADGGEITANYPARDWLHHRAAAAVSAALPAAEQLSAGHSGRSGAGELQRRIERGVWLSLAQCRVMEARASNECYPKVPDDFTITEKDPINVFSVIVKSSGTFG